MIFGPCHLGFSENANFVVVVFSFECQFNQNNYEFFKNKKNNPVFFAYVASKNWLPWKQGANPNDGVVKMSADKFWEKSENFIIIA